MAHLLGHMQVMSLQWIPFYVLALLRGIDRSRRGLSWLRSSLLAGLFLVLTGLCDWYFVLYLFLFTGLVVIWYSVATLRSPSRQSLGLRLSQVGSILLPPVTAGLLFLLVLSPILAPMLREATQFTFMVRPSTDLYILSASLMDFLVPNRLHTLFRPESFEWIGNQIAPVSERTISLGYLPLALAFGAVWADRRRTGLWAITALFFLLLAMGPRLHMGNITAADIPDAEQMTVPGWTPFAVLNRIVPFMRISRSVSRYALMVQLSVAVLAAIGLAAWLHLRPKFQWAQGLAIVAVVVVLAEFWVAPYPISPPDTPPYYADLAQHTGGAVLNLPMNYDRPGYLLYQTVHRRPLTVAYISRDDPRTLTERVPVLQHFRHLGPDILALDPAAVGQTVMADLDIDTVILDRYKMPGGLEREYTTELAQAIFSGQMPVYEDERLTVYTLTPPASPQAYLVLGELNWGPLLQGDRPGRRLGEGPAKILVRHAQPGARLTLRYHTLPDVKLDVLRPETGQVLVSLPAAPDGHSVELELDPLGIRAGGGGEWTAFALMTPVANGVTVEAIGLTPP
jgi:hypothetical protein